MFAKMASQKLFPTHSSSWLVLFPKGGLLGGWTKITFGSAEFLVAKMLPHSEESKTNVQPKNQFRCISLKELSFRIIDIVKSESEICTVSLPLKVSKFLEPCVRSSFVRKHHRHIFHHSNAAHASDIHSDKMHPSTQTDINAQASATHAVHNSVRYASFTRATKTAGSASRTLTFFLRTRHSSTPTTSAFFCCGV